MGRAVKILCLGEFSLGRISGSCEYTTPNSPTTLLLLYRYAIATVWQRMVYRGWVPEWGYVDNCSGSETAAFFGAGLLTSYLFLFIDFYIRTYKGSAAKTAKPNGKANGVKKTE